MSDDSLRERVRRERQEQGLPATITDRVALQKLAVLMDAADERNVSSARPPQQTPETTEEAIARLVAEAPPLSSGQAARLRAILSNTRGVARDA